MKVYAQSPTPECIEGLGPLGSFCKDLQENGNGGESVIRKLANIISQVIGAITILAGLFFLSQLFYAGFAWLSSGGDPEQLAHARNRITNSLIGLTIVVGALAIMAVVQFFFGVDFMLRDPTGLAEQLRGPTATPTP